MYLFTLKAAAKHDYLLNKPCSQSKSDLSSTTKSDLLFSNDCY